MTGSKEWMQISIKIDQYEFNFPKKLILLIKFYKSFSIINFKGN